ncbi:Magnesium transporter NIPA2 [Hondaea fermentalgiana]|uniref:Magnesium transporter NIPA2 n=1 Tax=Hondaea fermentalgiana TaxID=2315210 RepID=A0A2R5GLU7_9STRA|nr:Magnesium transporter NIPA2 [Hondaea fermentalgiana]|eukprot:GBG29603.1 Magnesium transporter NIPA2 [Hondaea fermentalgiana]
MSNFTAELTAELCLEMAVVTAEGEILSGLWYVGVILSILSSIASNLGVNIQKYSMLKEFQKMEEDHSYREKPYIFQKIWLLGLFMVIFGSIGDFAALGFAAQTLATPVGGFTMVANVFFAHFFLKERLSRRDILATMFVVVGVVIVAASADKTEKTYTLECLLKLYERTTFIVYVIGILFIVGILFAATRYLGRLRREDPHGEAYTRLRRFHPICPAALSGLIGAQSVLFAKCSAELIKKTIEGENQFANWQTYIIILCMFFTIFNQLHWLANGLRLFDAVLIIPVFQCFFITGGVIGGGVFFDEFRGLSLLLKLLFFLGVVTTVFGVFLLSQRDQSGIGEAKVAPETAVAEAPGQDLQSPREASIGSEHGSSSVFLNPSQEHDPIALAAAHAHAVNHAADDRPMTPLPMSLHHHGLVVSDLYTALRSASLSHETRRIPTPEHPMGGRRDTEPNVGTGRTGDPLATSDPTHKAVRMNSCPHPRK